VTGYQAWKNNIMANSLNISDKFLERYAAALRMEPDSRTSDLENGIAARTADPLWFLTRQWQVGEFEGEDAGSPIDADLTFETLSLSSAKFRNEEGLIISGNDPQQNGDAYPVEMLIEQEWLGIDLKVSAQIGEEFERQVFAFIVDDNQAREYVKSYRQAFPFDFRNAEEASSADEETRRFVRFMKNRVVNGRDVVNGLDFSSNSLTLPSSELQYTLPDDILISIGQYLVKWCTSMNIRKTRKRPGAWRNEQLDYRFRLDTGESSTTEEKILSAPEYRSGSLDWYTFNAHAELHESAKWRERTIKNILPTAINIMGLSRRWWELEDANIDIGHMEVGKVDVARMLLMQYALVYGDDWYSVPLPLEISTLAKIATLEVKNVFGETQHIRPAYHHVHEHIEANGGDPSDPMNHFSLFTLSPANGTAFSTNEAPVLYTPPVINLRQESAPLEEARFIRDEWSNMVWCIEHTVLNGIGNPVDGFKAQLKYLESGQEEKIEELLDEIAGLQKALATLQQTAPDYSIIKAQLQRKELELKNIAPERAYDESSLPEHRLATAVPENWIPFETFDASSIFGGDRNVRLRRLQMLRNTFDEEPTPIPAKTSLLELTGDPLLWLEEYVIPRSGLRICLTNQRVRWIDGQTFVWKGRKILSGRGEGESGLIFDKVFNLYNR
jgi:hypothetical protein